MDWPALIVAITGLVTAVGAVLGVIFHVKSPDPHPKVVTPLGQVIDNQTQVPVQK